MTDEERLEADKKEFEERWRAIEQESDDVKRGALLRDLDARIEQGLAESIVELVERVRARSGDKAAEEHLQALRALRAKRRNSN